MQYSLARCPQGYHRALQLTVHHAGVAEAGRILGTPQFAAGAGMSYLLG